ncbi:MAG: terminase, partial [Myxococcaceae bacterium]
MTDDRGGSLFAWQWSRYPEGHRDRRNLRVHALTVPVFQLGTLALLGGPLVSAWVAGLGFAAMGAAMMAQGRTHRLERTGPAPFRGPGDVVARI